MSEKSKYDGLSETSKNIAIEIENKLIGMSVNESSRILYKVIESIEINSTIIGYETKPEPITVKIA